MASQKFHYVVLLAITLMFMSFSSSVQETGTATYYTPPYQPSSCYGNKDEGGMIAAASDVFYEGGKACGHKYQVTCLSATPNSNPCSGGSVVVKIVDYCPSCRGTIDLSQDAFASIADLDAGVINVSFQKV